MEGLIAEIKRYEQEIVEMEFQNTKNRLIRILLRQEVQRLEERRKNLESVKKERLI